MKKKIFIIIIFFIGFITGACFFVNATSYNSEEITYDNSKSGSSKTNVKDAVDELYGLASIPKGPTCKRATTLHTRGDKIFGNESVRIGTLTAGDAFDCDVNGDGIYDGEKERFYYITELESDNTKAVLLYYSNTSNGVATPNKKIAYHSSNVNNQGPVTAKSDLPSLSQWKTNIYSNPRQITYNTGGNVLVFDYGDRAARLITMQELRSACKRTDNMNSAGNLDTCTYTMENTYYADTSLPKGYWLETPYSNNSDSVWFVYGDGRSVFTNYANNTSNFGARPAIEVPKYDIAY